MLLSSSKETNNLLNVYFVVIDSMEDSVENSMKAYMGPK